jgi:hypothetical protein
MKKQGATWLQFFVLLGSIVSGCEERHSAQTRTGHCDTIRVHDTVWRIGHDRLQHPDFTGDEIEDSLDGQPMQWYFKTKGCSPLAIDFYYGEFRPSDNRATEALLQLVVGNERQLTPLYRWCLLRTIQVQDGALAESTGLPARHYAEKFPEDFFRYVDEDSSGERYRLWTDAIAYSGFEDADNYEKPFAIQRVMIARMQSRLTGDKQKWQDRIQKFANDCFSVKQSD